MEQAGVQLVAQGAAAFGADMKTAEKAVDGFGASATKTAGLVQDAAGRWRTATGRFASDAEKAAAGVAKIIPAAKGAGDAAEKAGHDAERGGRGFHAFGEVVTGALRQVGVVAVQAFGQALRAGAAFIGDSIKLAGDFDQTMSVLQATSEATAEEMAAVSKKAKALGADLTLPATSAVDAGKAMLELSKAGFTVAESMDAAKGVLQLAAAAQISEARAAEINANALNAFGLEAKDSIFVSDLLAASANASSVEITDVAQSYQMAAAVFSSFQGPVVGAKESLVQLTTAIGILGNAGIKGSDAGTALKQSLLQLSGPSMKAKDEMRALFLATQAEGDAGQNLNLVLQGNAKARAEGLRGLQESAGATAELGDIAYDAAGNMRSLPEILRLTSLATKGMTAEMRDGAITTIFGADAMRAILVLMKQGPDAWNAMEGAVTRQGAAADLAAAQTAGYKGALEGAKSQVETLQLTIGQALTPVLAELLNNYISPGIAGLTLFAEALLGNEEAFKTLSPAMQDVVKTIREVAENVSQGIAIVQDMIGTFRNASSQSAELGSAVEDLNGIWTQALKVAENVLGGYEAIALAVLPAVTKFVDEHGTEIQAFLKSTWDSIIQIVTLALQLYSAIVPPILNAIAGFINDHGSEIQRTLSNVWTMITSLITGTLETIKGVLSLALHVINGDWKAAWGDIENIATAQMTAIKGFLTGFFDLIASLFNTSMAEIGQTWSDNWAMLLDIATSFDWQTVGYSVVLGVLKGLQDNWARLTGWVTDKIGGLVDNALEAIGAGSPATQWMPVGQFAVEGVMEGFKGMMPALTSLVAGLGDDLARQAADIATNVQNSIADGFGATASIDRQKIANMKSVDALDEKRQAGVSWQLEEAEKVAQAMHDPEQAAAFFKMRSGQIIEMGKLQGQIDAETDAAKRARLVEQYQLLNAAHNAELAQMRAQQQASGSDTQKLIDQIQALLNNTSMPGVLNDPIVAALFHYLEQLRNAAHRAFGGDVQSGKPYWVGEKGPELFWPGTSGSVMPAASSAQLARGNTTTNNSSSRTFNMPIYTNQSPSALQQSMAIMQASMV